MCDKQIYCTSYSVWQTNILHFIQCATSKYTALHNKCATCKKQLIEQSNLYIKDTKGNLKMSPLWIVALYIQIHHTVKPAHVVTCFTRSLFLLSCHRKFHMNWTSFKRSPFLYKYFLLISSVTSSLRLHYICTTFLRASEQFSSISWKKYLKLRFYKIMVMSDSN